LYILFIFNFDFEFVFLLVFKFGLIRDNITEIKLLLSKIYRGGGGDAHIYHTLFASICSIIYVCVPVIKISKEMFCLKTVNVALVAVLDRDFLCLIFCLAPVWDYRSCAALRTMSYGLLRRYNIMSVPRLCALVTKTGRGRRRLPLVGRKKYYNIFISLHFNYYYYYKIINIERTPPPTTVHPTPPRRTMLSDMYRRVYYAHRSIDSIFHFLYIIIMAFNCRTTRLQ